MRAFVNDLRFAVRILARTPAVTFAAILALAVAIGANTAIFSVVDAVLLEPLPYHQPDRIVTIWNSWQEKGYPQLPALPSDYVEWAKQATVFQQLGASQGMEVNVTGGAEAERLHAARSSHGLFPLLGVRPALGRGFVASDEQSPNVVVLSDGLWRRRFAARPDVVGQTMAIDGRGYTVVGVMPADFRFSVTWDRTGLSTPPIDLWVPLALRADELNDGFSLTVLARLKPGVSVEGAQAELRTIGNRISAQDPDHKAIGAHLVGLHDLLTREVRPAVVTLGVAVGLVLLIACANIANLLLSKASVRRREIAIRAALGAGRGRLVQQMLTESLALGALGGFCGVGLAWAGTALIARHAPAAVLRAGTIGLDLRTLTFTACVSLLSAILFGLAPALQALRVNIDTSLRASARGGVEGGAQGRLRSLLVVAEVALAVLLVVGSGLLLRSFVKIVSVDPGFRSEGLTIARVSLPASRYDTRARQSAFFEEMLSRVRGLPEISAVSAAATPPLEQGREIFFRIEGRGDDGDVRRAKVAGSIA
ncbi:MAG: FtsX-like permease family protein, partial [Acidobacteria bacterium]